MMRKLFVLALSIAAVSSGVARAGQTVKKALKVIPADAVGFVYVPNVKQVDDDFQQAVTRLGLNMFLQPPEKYSLTALLGEHLKASEGLDQGGCLAVVVMPFENAFELPMKVAIVLPATKPTALLDAMGAQVGESGGQTVTVMGQPWQVAVGEKRVVLAMMPDIAKAVAESTKSIDTKFKSADLKMLKDLDVGLWLDATSMISTFRMQIDQFLNLMVTMQQTGGPAAIQQAQASKKMIEKLIDGASSMMLGLSLDDGGLGIRFGMGIKPDSEIATQFAIHSTSETLLRGLPGERYIAAFGQTVNPDQVRASMDSFTPMFAAVKEEEGVDKDAVDRVESMFKEWIVGITGARGSVVTMPPGPDGLAAVNFIIDTKNSKKWLELTGKLFDEAIGMATDGEIKEYLGFLSHTAGAEEIAGVSIDHYKIDVDGLAAKEEVEDEDRESIAKVIGKEGLVLRVGAVDGKSVVFGLGGQSRMQRLIEQAKSKESPLDDDEGIKKVSAHLPSKRGSVIYVAFDQVLDLAKNVATALDEEMFPIQLPPMNAPLAIVTSGGDDWVRTDVFIPTDLLIASKNAGFMMLGKMGGGAPPAQPPADKPAG